MSWCLCVKPHWGFFLFFLFLSHIHAYLNIQQIWLLIICQTKSETIWVFQNVPEVNRVNYLPCSNHACSLYWFVCILAGSCRIFVTTLMYNRACETCVIVMHKYGAYKHVFFLLWNLLKTVIYVSWSIWTDPMTDWAHLFQCDKQNGLHSGRVPNATEDG